MGRKKSNDDFFYIFFFGLIFFIIYSQSKREELNTHRNVTCIAHDTKFSCDCLNSMSTMRLPPLEGFVYQIQIENCKSLIIDANSLEGTQDLRKIIVRNIDNLTLNQFAFAYSYHINKTPLIFEFTKVNFELIDSHAINGNIEEIHFIDCRIRNINSFGFSTLKERAALFKMDNVIVERIEQQAFKKFAVEQMEITNSIFESSVPSKAFYELVVQAGLRLDNVQFKKVHTKAFSFQKAAKLSITNCIFEATEAEWIEVFVKENVILQNNNFGLTNEISLKSIAVHREYTLSEPVELRFINNTVKFESQLRPIQFNQQFNVFISQLYYDNEFSCLYLDTTQTPLKPKEPFFSQYSDTIYMRRNNSNANKNGNSYEENYTVLNKIILWDCEESPYWIYLLIGVLSLLLVLVLVSIVVGWQLSKRRKLNKLDLVVPEPRTYKETQIVYQIENAGLLKTDF